MKVKLQKIKKRPCRICRKWFTPNNKLKERQKTCTDPECQKEWHKKTCAKLNKKYRNDFRSNYICKKKLKRPSSQKKWDLQTVKIMNYLLKK